MEKSKFNLHPYERFALFAEGEIIEVSDEVAQQCFDGVKFVRVGKPVTAVEDDGA